MALTILSVGLGALTAFAGCEPGTCTPQEPAPLQLSEFGREAFQTLLTAESFTNEAVGIAGVTSAEILALRTIWREPTAGRAFRQLEEQATVAGRLFALCGLYYADREAFLKRVEPYRTSDETVGFLEGCMMLEACPVSFLVERAEPGVVRLKTNQTVEAWLATGPKERRGRALDILGGGWPEIFREREPSQELRAKLTKPGVQAFRRLMVAERFTDDAIYDGGVTPNEVIAMRRLFREPEAREAFEELERRATLPGRLFGLCGLYYTNSSIFLERVEKYRNDEQLIFFQTGCEGIHDQPVARLVDRGEGKAVRLAAGQTNREWLTDREGSHGYDIVGGGWPNLFRDGGGWGAVRDEDYSPDGD